MSQEPINAEISLEEQLVAYLDGELDGESCRRIEQLLAIDPEVRHKLHWLEQTWEMLDELDTAPVGEDFTRTTLEMVAVAAEEDVRKNLEEAPRRRHRRWLLAGGGLLLAGLAGFMTFTLIAANPNKELIEDLPILENLDEYRQIRDITFLRMLRENRLFPKEDDIASSQSATARTGEDLLQHIKSLSSAEKVELLRRRNSYDGLDVAEQNRLRRLHEQIQKDERPDELRGIMNRYYEWYKLLPSYSRSELTSLSSEKRIEWIKDRLREDQSKISTKPPTPADSDALWNWMGDYAATREKKFIDNLPSQIKHNFSDMPAAARRRAVMWMIWQRQPGGSNKTSLLTVADLADLLSRFTPDTRKLLEAKPQAEQIGTVQTWAHNLLRQKRGPGMGNLVDDKLLAEFFEKELTDEQRDRLINMSGEDMQRELLRLYIMQNRPPDMFPHHPDGPPPGPPPDDDHRPDRQ